MHGSKIGFFELVYSNLFSECFFIWKIKNFERMAELLTAARAKFLPLVANKPELHRLVCLF